MISEQDALNHGLEVVEVAAKKFFATNSDNYQIYGYDLEDLVQYLHATILVPRYLRSARETPEFYPKIANYRSSLFVACRKALLAHYRQITAKKRSDLFRKGAIVRMNLEDQDTDQLPQVERYALFKSNERSDLVIRAITDQMCEIGEPLAANIFLLMAHHGSTRATLAKDFPSLSRMEIEESLDIIQNVITHYEPCLQN